ncbi:MAG: hypothetical protein CL489_10080 [Acidobacteria bacterium]|nr:hypothetical protein [Acidobacteriota bacterium]
MSPPEGFAVYLDRSARGRQPKVACFEGAAILSSNWRSVCVGRGTLLDLKFMAFRASMAAQN